MKEKQEVSNLKTVYNKDRLIRSEMSGREVFCHVEMHFYGNMQRNEKGKQLGSIYLYFQPLHCIVLLVSTKPYKCMALCVRSIPFKSFWLMVNIAPYRSYNCCDFSCRLHK